MSNEEKIDTEAVLVELDAARERRAEVYAELREANAALDEVLVRAYLQRHTWNTLVDRAGLSMPTIRQRLIKAGALTPRGER